MNDWMKNICMLDVFSMTLYNTSTGLWTLVVLLTTNDFIDVAIGEKFGNAHVH